VIVAATWAAARVDPEEARRRARDILDGRRFRAPSDPPRPLEGVLRWIGDRLEPLGKVFEPIWDFLTSPLGTVLAILALLALVAWIAMRVAARRGAAAGDERGLAARREHALDPAALEREADEAERAGDLDHALRLRFLAGLLRLDRAGAVHFRPSITSGQVARRLRLARFDDLAITFDSVAYGGRHATRADVDESRAAWRDVLTEVKSS
jgi:hypothetical protein